MKNTIIIILVVVSLFLFLRPRGTTIEYNEKIDTVYVDKIIKDTVPKLVYVTKLRIDTVEVYTTDSVLVQVSIPIEQKQYKGAIDSIGTYEANVSGYKAKLDSIKFNIKYPVITKEITKIKIPRFNHGLQVGVGYGVINKKPDLFVGYGITYRF